MEDEEIYMEFVRGDSVSQQEKVKAFWKYLDGQNCLQPNKGASEREPSLRETESPVPMSVEEVMKDKDMWRKGLKVFRQLGLDKTALAADKRCQVCHVQKTIRCDDEGLADTMTQPYEELNADMKAFDERYNESRTLNQCEAPYAGDQLNRRNSYYVKPKK